MAAHTDSTRLVCECGRSIRCTVVYEGERLGSLGFFGNPRPEEPRAERIAHCPGCGARLDPRLLVEALLNLAAR